jgi:nucleoside phosphorylase
VPSRNRPGPDRPPSGKLTGVTTTAARHVLVLAPMPLEMDAITTAFGLAPANGEKDPPFTGRVGNSDVTAVHIGMGPPLTRAALNRLLDQTNPDFRHVDHVMVAGICGGLDPDLDVGTLINAEVIVDHRTGAEYEHRPPGDEPRRGKIITTEEATMDHDLSRSFFANGCVGVDMENSAVAEVCEARNVPWSVYRCIGDRYFDGFLDERVLAVTNQDGSGNFEALNRLLEEDPEVRSNLQQLSRDTTMAARLAAEAAVRGCLALDD